MKKSLKPLTIAVGAALATSFGAGSVANADTSPFAMTALASGYMAAQHAGSADTSGSASHKTLGEGKCGEGKCGGDKGDKGEEGSCGGDKGEEGSCGGHKGEEGSCGGDKGEEGSCGGDKGEEGKCGEGKCGGSI